MTAKSVMDYTHWAEGAIIMIAQDLFSSKANAISIGESSRDGISQLAIKYGLDPDQEDDATKNAVVFECGMHAREWYAAESCYWLMDYLYRHYQDEQVQELLSEVDVWIIPQSNPAGRDLDDPALGDPTEYTYVCKGGVDSGSTCDLDSDCSSGWRTNANKTSCDVGVDLARNFSSGWNSAPAILRPPGGQLLSRAWWWRALHSRHGSRPKAALFSGTESALKCRCWVTSWPNSQSPAWRALRVRCWSPGSTWSMLLPPPGMSRVTDTSAISCKERLPRYATANRLPQRWLMLR